MSELDEFGYSKDFERCHLGDVAHIEMGQSPDSRFVFEDPYIGYPFLQGNAEFGVVSPSPKFGCVRPTKLVKKSDVLVSVRAPVGAVNIADRDYCIGRGLAGIRLSGIEPNLAAQLVQHQSADLRRVAQGTTFEAISKSDLQTLQLRLPPVAELPVIAQLLDTLDTAIHQTEAIVEKLKQVKQGLLHDLLTRGVDANGELRPCYETAPELYKESPLGWIPKEWDVVLVGDDTDIEHGFAFPGHQFTDKAVGPVLLVPGNFHREGGLYFTTENTKYFSGKYPQQYILSSGDVLVVMTDLSPMTLILGRTVLLNEKFKVLHNQRIGKFRFKKEGLWDTSFFAEAMSQDAVRLKVIAEATGTTVRHTSPDRIKSCYVARPKFPEQQISAQRIADVDERRKIEEANLLKLRQTKSGLMDDLLTGRVRVTPLLAQ